MIDYLTIQLKLLFYYSVSLIMVSLKNVLPLASFFLVLNAFCQPYAIGELTINITDANRSNRVIETKVFYPATAQGLGQPVAGSLGTQFPLIIIGHGFAMTYNTYQNFWQELVPRGYIVALPTKESSLIPFPSHADFGQDLAEVGKFFQLENSNIVSLFYGKVAGKTAIMGHSMGGGATFLAAANNPDVTAMVGFAPAETNPSAINAAPAIDIPALIFIGSKDNVTAAADNATPLYNGLSSSCKSYITITDGNHCRFANSNATCELGETTVCIGCSFISRQVQHSITFSFLNPWLDFHLKGDCDQWTVFQNRLTTGQQITYQQNCNITQPVAAFHVTGDTISCQGGSATLTATGNYDYTWSTGDTGSTIILDSTGTYFLVAEVGYGCRDTSGSISFTVGGGVKPVIMRWPEFTLCENDSVMLYVTGEFASYQWPDGSTGITLITNKPGAYYVKLTDDYGCEINSDTMDILHAANPDIPGIRLEGDSLVAVSGEAVYYQWFFDDASLDGFNESYLKPYFEGAYAVQIWDSNGCSAISEIFDYHISFIPGNAIKTGISVYPNPTNGLLLLGEDIQEIRIYNLTGEELSYGFNLSSIDLSNLESGVYILRAGKDDKYSFVKIFKN